MHQRQPITIEKGRDFSGKNGPTQVSFHKIYRKKRCYSLVDKEQEGQGGFLWKAGFVNSQRDSDGVSRRKISSGFSSCKPTQGIDYRQGNHSSSYSGNLPNRENANGYRRQYLKRPNDRNGCNSVSRPEFDVPFVKKQKVEKYKIPASQHGVSHETGQDEQKMVYDDTKWMYKNQHAQMSGPYGVRQLIEGFHSRFLHKDLPVHQLLDGELCKPIMLKQLVDDVESYSSPMHNLKRHPSQSFSEESFCKFAPSESPNKSIKDEDLPPGFGGRSTALSQRPNSFCRPNSPISTGAKHSVGSLSSSGVADFDLPPGFEAIAGRASSTEPHITELSGSSRRLSTGASMGMRGEGGQGTQLGYGKLELAVHSQGHSNYQGSLPNTPVSFTRLGAKSSLDTSRHLQPIVHTGGHLSQQNCSPPSIVSFTLQGARNLNESSSREATWGFTSPNTGISHLEPQSFSSRTFCIGLPVSEPAMQDWPVANCLPISCAEAIQANNELLPRKFSVKHGLDPLLLIHLELLAAVQKSYVKTVLSALIDEQLKCWMDSKSIMARSVWTDDSSRSGEASSLSSAEFGVTTMEANAFQTDAAKDPKILLQERAAGCSDGSCLNAHVESAENSVGMRAAQCDDCSGLSTQSASMSEPHCSLPEAVSPRKDANTCSSFAITDAKLPSNREPESLDTSVPFFVRESMELYQSSNKADTFLSINEGSKSSNSFTLLATSDGNYKQVLLDHTEEVQHQSGDELLQGGCASVDRSQRSGKTSDAVLLETEPSFLVCGKKKCNMKSLRHLMKITSKLRPRHSNVSSAKNKIEKLSRGTAPETLETNLQVGVLSFEGYNGCARTSFDGWLWRKLVGHASHTKGVQVSDCRLVCIELNGRTARTHRARLRKLPPAAKVTHTEAKLKLSRSRIHEWGVFAVEPMEAGDFVIEYVGEVLRPRIADIRERRYKDSGIGSKFLFRVDDETVVDATKRGGLARFMNYSCDPNCSAKIISVEGSKKVYIYARRHITAGEEVTYDCKFQLEDQKIPCNCGSTRCRGSSN